MAASTSVSDTALDAHGSPEGGWVAYHDVSGPLRTPALAMTWAVPGEGVRWAAVVDRVINKRIAWTGSLPEGGDVAKALMAGFSKMGEHSLPKDRDVLALMFPHGNAPAATSGLPALPIHSDLARRALDEAAISPEMRKALLTCISHGVPKDLSALRGMADGSFIDWKRFDFATEHQHFVQTVYPMDESLRYAEEPLTAITRKWPGLTEGHLRRLPEREPGFTGPGVVTGGKHEVNASISLMAAIPVDWMPLAEDVRGFNEAASAIARLACLSSPDYLISATLGLSTAPTLPATLEPSVARRIPALVSGAKGDWEMLALRMFREAGVDNNRADGFSLHMLAGKCNDCKDPLQSLSETLLQPMMAWRDGMEPRTKAKRQEGRHWRSEPRPDPYVRVAAGAAYELLYGGKSAHAVLETSARWHVHQQRMQAEIRRNAGKEGWPGLFQGEYRQGDVAVVPVTDYDALRDEGTKGHDREGRPGLNHCVLSYLPRLLAGRTHVLSVRKYEPDGSWRRLSTCQVSVEQSLGRFPHVSVVQHRGPNNKDPVPEASRAVHGLREQLQSAGLPMNPAALAARESTLAACGYDWRRPGELANALAVWEPVLPRWARGHDPSGFLDALAERGLIPEPKNDTVVRPAM